MAFANFRCARRRVCLAVVVFAHVAAAAEPSVERIYDPTQWKVVKSARAHFGRTRFAATVLKLRSVAATGEDGVGRPLHSANLIVTENGRVLYAFASLSVPPRDDSGLSPVFDIDDLDKARDTLQVRDLTGDRVPEVIFRSGFRGASDWENIVHVLQYVPDGDPSFQDIRLDAFAESWWYGVRLLDLDGNAFVVVAEPVNPPVAPGDFVSHGEPRFHRYAVYGWSERNHRFELQTTIQETRRLHDSAAAGLDADWPYIVAQTKARRIARK